MLEESKPIWDWKSELSARTEKEKNSPAINQAGRTDTDKAGSKVNRKHCFSQGHAAVVKYHNYLLFEWLLLFLWTMPPDLLCYFHLLLEGDTQCLNHPDSRQNPTPW